VDRGSDDRRATRVLIVEDQLSHAHVTMARVLEARGPRGLTARLAAVMEHAEALDHAARPAPDVALVDAMRHPNDLRDDPGALGFAGLAIAQALHDQLPSCRVVGYSSAARQPAINIAFREVPNVVAVYDQAILAEHVDEALWSDDHPHQTPPPTVDDYAVLGVSPEARLWEALRFVMRREDTWEAVARTRGYLGVAKRTREHLNKHLGPLLPMPDATRYRAYVELLREVAGFP